MSQSSQNGIFRLWTTKYSRFGNYTICMTYTLIFSTQLTKYKRMSLTQDVIFPKKWYVVKNICVVKNLVSSTQIFSENKLFMHISLDNIVASKQCFTGWEGHWSETLRLRSSLRFSCWDSPSKSKRVDNQRKLNSNWEQCPSCHLVDVKLNVAMCVNLIFSG